VEAPPPGLGGEAPPSAREPGSAGGGGRGGGAGRGAGGGGPPPGTAPPGGGPGRPRPPPPRPSARAPPRPPPPSLPGSRADGGASPPSPGGGASTSGIRLAGATNEVHLFHVARGEWQRAAPEGTPPTARAAHAAAAVGNMVVVQGGIGPHGLADNDLHVLDFSHPGRPKWHRVVVAGASPGPRYAHTLALVVNRFLVIAGGNDGKQTLSDCWALDTSEKPYQWTRVGATDGRQPAGRMYAAAAPRRDGLMLLCGGRDARGTPLADAFGLSRHRDGRWWWAEAPGAMPAGRYQHGAVFVEGRLHVVGGAVGGGRMVDEEGSATVYDLDAGTWVTRAGAAGADGAVGAGASAAPRAPGAELTRRCRHAVASVGPMVFVYGGLRGSTLLEDLLVLDDGPAVGAGAAAAAAAAAGARGVVHCAP